MMRASGNDTSEWESAGRLGSETAQRNFGVDRERGFIAPARTNKPPAPSKQGPGLAIRHFLSHVQQETPVAFINAAHQPAELGQVTSFFSVTAPGDFISGFALGEVGKHGRLFAVVEELIEWNFESARHFLQCLDRWNGVAVLDARDVTTEKPGPLFDVPLGEFLFFA
jgi:hypothetical protein